MFEEVDVDDAGSRMRRNLRRNQRTLIIGGVVVAVACICLVFLSGVIAVSIWGAAESTEDSDDGDGSETWTCRSAWAAQYLAAALDGGRNRALADLTALCDGFGPRIVGSAALANATTFLAHRYEPVLDNVQQLPVNVTPWERGTESLELLSPWSKTLSALGLGFSVGTPAEGVTAELLVVSSFEELNAKAAQAAGKIVVFNQPWEGYGTSVQYRSGGASAAARVGAIGALVRSVTPYSLYTPHTGVQMYASDIPNPIPVMSITVEDAQMFARMQAAGVTPRVRMTMGCRTLPQAVGHNLVAELTGSTYPKEVVVMGGHIDSWDVGQGAVDDGGGVLVAFESLRLLRELGFRPQRTLRAVAFVSEENGGLGGQAYYDWSAARGETTLMASESDSGINAPAGMGFSGFSEDQSAQLRAFSAQLEGYGLPSYLGDGRGGGADIAPFTRAGVPTTALISGEHNGANMTYFYYHHTNSDTIDKVDPYSVLAATALSGYYTACVAEFGVTFLPQGN